MRNGLCKGKRAGVICFDYTAQVLIESDPQTARQLMATITEQAKEVVAEVRRLVYALRPPALDELGLVRATERLAQQHGSADADAQRD